MPKKKKGKSKAPLTEEERQLLAEKEAADQSKRAEMKLKFLKEQLEMEERNSRINTKKLNAQWRVLLRKAKAEALKQDIGVLSQSFERVVDRKSAIIQALLLDLQEAEAQEQLAVQSHLQNLDQLSGLQQQTMSELHGQFNAELEVIKDEFLSEREQIVAQHDKEMSDLKNILFAMEMLHQERENADQAEFHGKRDDIRSKNLDVRSTLKAALESQIADLWEQFQKAQKTYEQNTAEKRAEFERLRAKDEQCAVTIEVQTRKLQRLQDQLASLKLRLSTNQRENDLRNKNLKQEKEKVLVHFQELKGQMNVGRLREKEHLTKLTVESRKCTKKLKERLGQAEKILKLAEICRKLETEEEKVLPFYRDTVTQDEVAEAEGAVPTGPLPEPEPIAPNATAYTQDNAPVETYNALEQFWKRYNKVLLDKLAIEKEQQAEEEENLQLRSLLKQYLDGISVSEEVLANDNTLLIINNRSNLAVGGNPIPVGDQRVKQQRPSAVQVGAAAGSRPRKARAT